MASSRIIPSFLVTLILFQHTFALRDVCRASYNTKIERACFGLHKACCMFSPPCSLTHSMRGYWVTELDMAPTRPKCEEACKAHTVKCQDKCECMVKVGEVRSSKVCKCVRLESADIIQRKCNALCITRYNVCVRKCLSSESCPLKAVTNIKFSETFEGKCAPICPPRTPGAVPVCIRPNETS